MCTIPSARLFALGFALAAAPLAARTTLPPGVWTNTEDAYFADEEGRAEPAWLAIEVRRDGRWRSIDAFGEPLSEWRDDAVPGLVQEANGGGWAVHGSELRHARAFSCWISVRTFADKPDGTANWTFANGLRSFDQGGRIRIAGSASAPEVTIRLRQVTWARGSRNKPSLVLYVHRDDQDRAESYAWASPDADLIGINLRWMQASCSPVAEPSGE